MAVGSIVQLILYDFEKLQRFRAGGVIVPAGGIEIQYLPVQHLFRGADIPDAVKQLFPIVPAAMAFQPFVVQRKALDHVLLQARRGPLAETGGCDRLDAVAERDDHVEVIEGHHIVFTVSGSCSEFPNNLIFFQFPLGKNMLDMLADIGFTGLVQVAELRLCQPYRLVLKAYINFCQPILGLIEDDFTVFSHRYSLPLAAIISYTQFFTIKTHVRRSCSGRTSSV